MSNLPLAPVVNVTVNVSSGGTVRDNYSLGLIVGPSAVISTADRVKVYSSMDEVVAAGFTSSMPEYAAASLYFSQTPQPSRLALGFWDKENAETALDAVTACRAANREWYAVTVLSATDEEIQSVAAYIESLGDAVYFACSSTAAILSSAEGNLLSALATAKYKRTLFLYSATTDAVVSLMAYAMGANTRAANSAYTLAYKTLPGISPDDLTVAQVSTVKNNHGNVYISRGKTYQIVEPGIMTDGTYFDEVIGLDMLANALQTAVMNLLTNVNKVPQTESGVTDILNVLSAACGPFVTSGFIAPGVWQGPAVLDLQTGDTLDSGFLFQAQPLAEQPQADREARRSPRIYGAVKLAGAVQYVTIECNVNR